MEAGVLLAAELMVRLLGPEVKVSGSSSMG